MWGQTLGPFARRQAPCFKADGPRRTLFLVTALLLLIVSLISLGQGASNALERSQDLLYRQASLIAEGVNAYALYLEGCVHNRTPCLWTWQQHSEIPTYPVSTYLLLAPLTLLERADAAVLWLLTNLSALGGSLWLLWRKAKDSISAELFLILALIFLSSSPVRIALGNGQQSILVLFLFLAAWSLVEKRPLVAGVLLGLSWLKFTMTIPLALFFLWRRDWKVLFVAGGLQALLICAGALHLGEMPWSLVRQQLQVGSHALTLGPLDLPSLLARHELTGGISQYVFTLPLLELAAALVFLPSARGRWLFLAFIAFAAQAFVYHLIYDFMLLLFPALYLLQRQEPAGRLEVVTGGFAVLYFWHLFKLVEFLEQLLPAAGVLSRPLYWTAVAAFYLFGIVLTAKLAAGVRHPSRWSWRSLLRASPSGVSTGHEDARASRLLPKGP